ncbi:unnamed protein product [Parnassius apollo]|uniref:(apollo) hypothetical protein n=1 Tax=Parnassius apollo TaxID=110799 RepID=A0A8S3X7X4_PARAO|nr:unnamed protein product [Parnassius apollo]
MSSILSGTVRRPPIYLRGKLLGAALGRLNKSTYACRSSFLADLQAIDELEKQLTQRDSPLLEIPCCSEICDDTEVILHRRENRKRRYVIESGDEDENPEQQVSTRLESDLRYEPAGLAKRDKEIIKPKIVVDYNNAKSSVDLSDQMIAYSTPLRKSVKWYRKLGVELLLNIALLNSYVIYKETTKSKIGIVEYRKKLCKNLTESGKENSNPDMPLTRNRRQKHELKRKKDL